MQANRGYWQLGFLGLASGLAMLALVRPAMAESDLWQAVGGLALSDCRGQETTLGQVAGQAPLVVVFLGTECPLARLYGPRLQQLAEEFGPRGVAFAAVMSNRQDTAEEAARYAKQYGLRFPVLCDPRQRMADAFGARRTPEAFLLDTQHVVRYHGRIDDQFVVGFQKPQVGRRDLAVAIDELVSGQPVSQAELPATGCVIGREAVADLSSPVTYHGQVAAILDKHCAGCHRPGEIGPFSLTSYGETQGWGETIREVLQSGRMPPWFADPAVGHFANDTRLSPQEKETLLGWIDAGCPEGPPSSGELAGAEDLPTPAGDEIVLAMSERPFSVPAEGLVDYQTYTVDPGWSEDQWIERVEVRPGNPSVVHHILVFVTDPHGISIPIFPGDLIGGYVPGLQNLRMPPGMAMCLPAGSKIVFQMHYTPNGTPAEDCSEIRLHRADPTKITHRVRSQKAINILFQIPPRDEDYEAQATYMFAQDTLLLSLIPHMHLRGKSFRYDLEYPDGRQEALLSVPRWDFNWQLEYVLAEPKPVPRGTRLIATAHYDNSPANPANPDAERWVTFGEQTHQEMLIGFFLIAEPKDSTGPLTSHDRLAPALGLIRDLIQPQPWTKKAVRLTDQADLWVRSAGRKGWLRRPEAVEEVPQVIRSALAEAEKQQVLRAQRPIIDVDKVPSFVERIRAAIRGVDGSADQPQ